MVDKVTVGKAFLLSLWFFICSAPPYLVTVFPLVHNIYIYIAELTETVGEEKHTNNERWESN